MAKLEVIALTLQDADEAQLGGASSVELCRDMSVGGLSPDLDLVRAIRDRVSIHIRVMVRSHGPGFLYSAQDMDHMLAYTETLNRIGVSGVVFGALRQDSTLALEQVQQIASAVGPFEVTLHRAIDESSDAPQALDALRGTVQRILTSGHAPTVWEGRETIKAWLREYGESFTFACGGGLRAEHLAQTVREIGAPEYHVGTAARSNDLVDRVKVRAMVDVLS